MIANTGRRTIGAEADTFAPHCATSRCIGPLSPIVRLAAIAVLPLLTVPSAGPVLSGERPVWTQDALDGSVSVEAGAPRQRLRVQTLRDPRGERGVLSGIENTLAGGSDGFTFSFTGINGSLHQTCGGDCFSPAFGDVGRFRGGTVTPVVSDRCQIAAAEADGEVVAVHQSRCAAENKGVVTVRGPAGEYRDTASSDDVHVAGRYAAWEAADQHIVIYDAVAGRVVTRFFQEGLIDLQTDGKVLVDTGGRAAWRTLDDGTIHPLPTFSARRMDGDRVLARKERGLEIIGLDGSRRDVVTLRGREHFAGEVDLRGDRIVWARATCSGADVRVERVGRPVTLSSTGRCRVQLRRRVELVEFDGILRVLAPVRCHEYSLAQCPDAVRIDAARRAGGAVTRRRSQESILDPEHFLEPAGARLLARTGRLRVRVSAPDLAPITTTMRTTPAALRVLRSCLRRSSAAACVED